MLKFFQSSRSSFGRKFALASIRNSGPVIFRRELQGLVVGVAKETIEGEHRVAVTPVHVAKLIKSGATVNVEHDAGVMSGFTNQMYDNAGAKLVSSDEVWKSQIVTKVR